MDMHVSMLHSLTTDVLSVNGFFGMDITMEIAWITQSRCGSLKKKCMFKSSYIFITNGLTSSHTKYYC